MGTDQAGGDRLTRHGLYTDRRGAAAASALLFLHGGPGQGCHDFMAIQGDLLAESVRLIGIDQRGVDRSAPLPVKGDGEAGGAPRRGSAEPSQTCSVIAHREGRLRRFVSGVEAWVSTPHIG
jgi:proline iminopeptidase